MALVPVSLGLEITDTESRHPDRFWSKKPCPRCGRLFSTASAMRPHLDEKHDGKEGKS